MAHRTTGRLACQINRVRRQVDETPGLSVARWLPAERIQRVLDEMQVCYQECIYTPLVTVWLFVNQMLDACQSCVQVVARLLADRVQRGLPACSAATGAYCEARKHLPEKVLQRLVEQTGQELDASASGDWRWHGRRVLVVDGTKPSMPDTPANHEGFAPTPGQKPGLCFPLAQVVAVFSLAVGTVLAAAIGRGQGKGQGETSLWHQLRHHLRLDDLVLGDRYYASFAEFAWCIQHSVAAVMRLHANRRVDFRRGQRLGKDDHIAIWHKPVNGPAWLTPAEYAALPPTLRVRELRVRVPQAGQRTKTIVVVTSLTDAETYPVADLAALYKSRWHAELDFRSLKTTLHMDVLRCKTPDLVRKEIWAHLLAYNLIRTVMAQAAAAHHLPPRTLSFAGAMQTLEAFATVWLGTDPSLWQKELFIALVAHRVGNRPGRIEPRARKRRPKPYPLLTEPRQAARKRLLKGGCK